MGRQVWLLGKFLLVYGMGAIGLGILCPPPALADVSINKSFNPTTINPGDPSTLTISLFNSATTLRDGATFVDNLPAGVSIAATPSAVNGCGGDLTLDTVNRRISLTNGTIPAQSGNQPGKCNITVNVVSTVPGNKINTIPAGGLTVANGETNDTEANATLTIRTLDPLSGSLSFNANTVPPNGRSRLTITLNNTNSVSVGGTSFTNSLPGGMTVSTTPNPAFSCNNSGGTGGGQIAIASDRSSFTVSNLTIPAKATNNGSCSLAIDIIAPSSNASYTNTIAAGSVTNARGISNTAFNGSITVTGQARISKSFTTPGTLGNPFDLRITITNGSLLNLTNTSLLDNLPSATGDSTRWMVVDSIPTSPIVCRDGNNNIVTTNTEASVTATNSNRSVQISGLTIPPATALGFGNCVITVRVKTTALGSYANNVPATNFSNDQNVASTTAATATATVRNPTTGGGAGNTTPLTIGKSFNLSSIAANGTSTLTITITNPVGNKDLTSLAVTDNLPAGITIASSPSSSSTCNFLGNPTVTATANSSLLRITGGSLRAGTSCIVRANVTGTIAGTYTNTIPTSNVTNAQNIAPASAATSDLTIVPGARITQSFNGNTIAVNGISRLRIDIDNFQTAAALTSAAFSETFGTGIKIASDPNLVNSCGGTVTATPNATSLSLSGGTIPIAFSNPSPGRCTIEVNVTKTSTGTHTSTIAVNNFTSFLGGNPSIVVRNPVAASASLNALSSLGIGVNKSISPNSITGGSTANMTIVLSNNSSAATLTGIGFTDNMPSGMLVSTQPDLVNTCGRLVTYNNPPTGNSTLTLVDGTLAPSASCTISIRISSSIAGNLTNTIPAKTISSREGALNSSAASASITFLPFPGISKSFSPNKISPGGVSRLTVQISNFGTSSLSGVALTDNLPADLSFAPAPNLNTNCAGGSVTTFNNQLRLTGVNLAPRSSCNFAADVTATIPKNYLNQIPANALISNNGSTNLDPASANLEVFIQPRPGLLLVKRITAINGIPTTRDGRSLSDYTDRPDNPYDDNAITIPTQPLPSSPPKDTDRWPSINSFLVGGVDGGAVKSGDVVEYTIYFLSTGDVLAKNTTLCDLIPNYQSFIPTAFNGEYASQTAQASGFDRGLLLFTNNTNSFLSNINDDDAGTYYPPNSSLPHACRTSSSSSTPDNVNGAVVFKLGDLPIATPSGSPPEPASYGYVRFRAVVK
jgi:uncharacterized repeat protein (TIGR01451 family)